MRKSALPAPFGQEKINTLGLTGTALAAKRSQLIAGQGSDMKRPDYGKNRGKRKIIANSVCLPLIDISKEKGDEKMEKCFWNTYHCQEEVITKDSKLYGNYCKNRICPICSGIRKAELIHKYKPLIATWEEPYFVTLTVLACKAGELKAKLKKVKVTFETIVRRYKQQHKRGKGMKVMGVRSIECNFNPDKKSYNPHIHLIVPNKKLANLLMSTWLKEWGVWEATGEHQDKRPIKNLDHDLVETIKYGTKFFTEPDPTRKDKKAPRAVYIRAMYNIISAMRDMKQFSRFGFNLPKTKQPEKTPARLISDFQKFIYVPGIGDWIDDETGNPLTAYSMPKELEDLLQNCIDVDSE